MSKNQILKEIEKIKVEEVPENLVEEEVKILSQGMSEDEAKKTIQEVRSSKNCGLIEFVVDQHDMVYPMVPAGANLHEMIRRPNNDVKKKSIKATEEN